MITLKEGDKAPAFTGIDQDGKKVSLADYKGKKLVLYFIRRMTRLLALYRLVICATIMRCY